MGIFDINHMQLDSIAREIEYDIEETKKRIKELDDEDDEKSP